MANAQAANTLYIDSTGAVSTTTNIKVAYVIFTPANAADAIVLRETNGGTIKLSLKSSTNTTQIFSTDIKPIVFSQGIYCSALTAGAVATLVLAGPGDGSP